MIAVGAVIRRKPDKTRWQVVAIDAANGNYVLQPDDEFGANVAVSAAELRRWGVVASEPARPEADSSWDRFAERFRAVTNRRRRPLYASTPEESLALGEAEGARATAERIASGPGGEDRLAEHAIGVLPVSAAVGAALDDLSAAVGAALDDEIAR